MSSGDVHLATLLAAAGEPSKVPFYVAGGLLASWAVLVSFLGLRRPDFPGTPWRTRLVMGISAVLVLAATSMAVATSAMKRHAEAAAASRPPAGASAQTLALAADPGGQLRYAQASLHAKAGEVAIAFTNSSRTPHNVTITSGTHALAATTTITAAKASVTAKLKPGAYAFYCSVDSHRQAGMQGTLTVG